MEIDRKRVIPGTGVGALRVHAVEGNGNAEAGWITCRLSQPHQGCVAARHGNQWRFLGGGRAAPYACTIGDRTLTIEADRIYFDINGRKLGQLGQMPDKVLFDRAKSFRETHIRWTWTP